MLWKMFSVYDTSAAVYQRPFVARELGEATRAFCDIVRDKQHPIGQHPEDYTLHHIAQFDDTSGVVASLENREVVITGIEARAENRRNDAADLGFTEDNTDA